TRVARPAGEPPWSGASPRSNRPSRPDPGGSTLPTSAERGRWGNRPNEPHWTNVLLNGTSVARNLIIVSSIPGLPERRSGSDATSRRPARHCSRLARPPPGARGRINPATREEKEQQMRRLLSLIAALGL